MTESKDAGSTELDYAKEFWSTANAVTVFAVLQMIAYMLAIGANDSKIRDGVISIYWYVQSAIIVSTVLYSLMVWLLGEWQVALIESNGIQTLSKRLRFVGWCRIALIILANSTGICITAQLRV